MRVVLVTTIERGGPIEQALLLARGLARQGASVLVTCANVQLAERFAVDGVRAAVVPLRHQGDVAGAARVWRLARGADVIHAHDRRAGLWTRIGPRPRRRGLRVYTAHGIPEPYHPPPVGPERPGWKATLLYRGLDGGLCRRADAIVVPSRAVADDLVARLGYPRRLLHVIPNGIELPSPREHDGELIGTFSVLEQFKGIDVFLRAVARLAPERPEWRFASFGVGSDAERLRALAAELGIAERIEWPGFVPGPQARARLRVYVLSSYWENAPMALLEAMADGVPVVATAVDGVPEIVDETTARMVPSGDPAALAAAIEQAVGDQAGTAARVAAARRRVEERYTAERNAEAIGALYERLLRGEASR
ncbi:glycosyltransferase [Conexibacter arvalis]|uniref:Glycosyltransferase involved in cell wall biosynthesis n=1 Tax=Conexibacter arvalis TaxID=912552 RepID=A0A840ICI8_9ACTN|nr:glycosyltransferase [Conexibacter arvalis]MBB4661660.1 glycosyltransferase involved in cell wall biosynthesis [Conexibacter arvalis]